MVKKKKVRKVSKKNVKRKAPVRKSSQKMASSRDSIKVGGLGGRRTQVNPRRRLAIALYNFVFFLILSLVSYLLYVVSTEVIFVNLFFIVYILFGFVSLAFLIAALIFLFLKK